MSTVLVTGGSRGIGAATVRALAGRYNVAFTYNAPESAALALEQELAGKGGVKAFRCDVSDSASVKKAADEIRKRFGAVDMIVNSAGIAEKGLFQDITDEEWRKIFAVNVDGTFYVTREFLPDMISRQRGAIVNVSSVWGVVGASVETAYSATKAAIIGLTKALSKEVAPSGITVNAVAPGAVDTDMLNCYSAEEKAEICRDIPLGRMATADEIAKAIVFLLENGYVTGQVLTVDGGFAG